jgi:hypothetical protein
MNRSLMKQNAGGDEIMATINELICPVCGKSLTSEEYKHAIEEIRTKLGEEYQQQITKDRTEFEEQIQNERKLFREKIDYINRNHDEQVQILRDQLVASYSQQMEDLKKGYEELDFQRQKRSKEALDDKVAAYKQQISELSAQVAKVQQESQEIKQNAFGEARAALQKDLHTKDIEIRERDAQILNCKGTIEDLKRQLSSTQPERKGEAGEQDLLEDLREAFPEDQFSRQTRGISEGDIIQRIRTPSGTLLKVPIVYDNKEVAKVTKKEIEKQQYYKEHEQTDHLLIVSPNLPKSIKNGIWGRKEGISLVRRDIAMEVAQYLRGAIIEISKSSDSKKNRETKQARIYDYITSREFGRKIESLERDNSEMTKLQNEEEKDHQTMWKKRKAIAQRSRSTYTAISSEVDSIIHGRLPVESEDDSREGVKNNKRDSTEDGGK